MNPKMTEFLAQDRIAAFQNEAAGHRLDRGTASTAPKTAPVRAASRTAPFAMFVRRVRAAIAV